MLSYCLFYEDMKKGVVLIGKNLRIIYLELELKYYDILMGHTIYRDIRNDFKLRIS